MACGLGVGRSGPGLGPQSTGDLLRTGSGLPPSTHFSFSLSGRYLCSSSWSYLSNLSPSCYGSVRFRACPLPLAKQGCRGGVLST